jgi:hypothetical protein
MYMSFAAAVFCILYSLYVARFMYRRPPYLTNFSYRCWFLNCSVQRAVWKVKVNLSRLFVPKWHSLRSLPFQGPNKSRFGPTPSTCHRNGFSRMKIIFLCPFAVYYLRYAVGSFFTISRRRQKSGTKITA